MMYAKLANYSGIPSITIPSGFATDGLPTGIMLSVNIHYQRQINVDF